MGGRCVASAPAFYSASRTWARFVPFRGLLQPENRVAAVPRPNLHVDADVGAVVKADSIDTSVVAPAQTGKYKASLGLSV